MRGGFASDDIRLGGIMSTNSPPSDVFNRLLTTAVVVAIHAFLWSAWLLGVWVWMLCTERIFREFQHEVA